MPTLEEGRAILIDTVVNKKTHKHYERVTELAELYRKLITGDKINTLLKKFVRREDDKQFEQRELMTQAITPAVSSSLMNPFYKVGRSNSIVKELDFKESEESDDKLINITEAIAEYNGDKSLDDYLEERFVDLNFTDPNSFVITEFDEVPIGPQGQMKEKVKPRPFEVSCEEAVNFFYKNNILKWVIVKLAIAYVSGKGDQKKKEDGFSWTIYLENEGIKLTQVDKEYVDVEVGKTAQYTFSTSQGQITQNFFRASEGELYLIEEFEHKAKIVPARRVGYKKDLVTKGETFVSPMHDALCYFMKSIKTVSEFDLTMALHAFPQKFQYGPRCMGESEKISCNNGETPEGKMCNKCKGAGVFIHTSAQDGLVVRQPKDLKDMVDLSKFVYYAQPPIDTVKFQNEFIKELKNEARQAVFNSEIFNRAQIANPATATEVKISIESVYDTLFPFAKAYSSMYKYQVLVISAFRDVSDVIVEHKFPKDFKFKTMSDLLYDLKIASESNAPGYVKNQIALDIAEQQFIDKPDEYLRIVTKQKFFPFPDKNPTEIVYIISNGLTTEYNKVIWGNFDYIFQSIEQDAEAASKYFYDYAYKLQKELVDNKVKELMLEIAGELPGASVDFKEASQGDSQPGGQPAT
ncbi:MAG: hypothetical protein V4549_06665 [Bacteroidota bacterium]